MRIAIDWDGTVITQDRPYADTTTPMEFVDGARDALLSLKRAGHLLLLWSGRASRALLVDPTLDPFVRAGVTQVDRAHWLASRAIHRARYEQMIEFVERELPGVFDAIDDGLAGKPSVDLFIDDKTMVMRGPATWARIARVYGETEPLFGEEALVSLLDRPVESLNLVPAGTLRGILAQIRIELMAAGVPHYEPNYELGQAGFWAADRATTVNIPWFLANDELRELAQPRYPWTWDDVAKSIRHEVGHSVNYAFELWQRPDWTAVFGDFTIPYPKSQPKPVDPASELGKRFTELARRPGQHRLGQLRAGRRVRVQRSPPRRSVGRGLRRLVGSGERLARAIPARDWRPCEARLHRRPQARAGRIPEQPRSGPPDQVA